MNLGRAGETNFITESGLYAVVLRSDKPASKKFRKWVTGTMNQIEMVEINFVLE